MKKLLFAVLRYSGLPAFYRQFIQKRKVSVLVFHDIDLETAELTFEYLSQHYNFIPLNDLIQAIETNEENILPKKAMVITFDDGHVRNYQLLPVFKKYQVPVTIFLCSGIIDTFRNYWFLHERDTKIQKHLKTISNKERLDFLSLSGYSNEKEYKHQNALSASQISDMTPYVNFQSHTVFHPILTQCDDEESNWEITKAKFALEKKLERPINAIAYPNGNYTKREILFSKNAGYQCGLTVKAGFNSIKSDPFELKRLDLNDSNDINEIIVKSSGIHSLFNFSN
ncbi:polysaccharide deacetylase family protein [uncultured Cyclobacterium sp.]|uniref:polysaccharide deacetylase family protein n=1 Tax=uncultured Cyclobacterium sp. TaxID=453820 RepID=UPI0030EBF3D5|tara:strand:+ start:140147 stop:140995 length:849 start_codon:yes stop_codon:yes gene_type:complete